MIKTTNLLRLPQHPIDMFIQKKKKGEASASPLHNLGVVTFHVYSLASILYP
jgi:hypothetical protein